MRPPPRYTWSGCATRALGLRTAADALVVSDVQRVPHDTWYASAPDSAALAGVHQLGDKALLHGLASDGVSRVLSEGIVVHVAVEGEVAQTLHVAVAIISDLKSVAVKGHGKTDTQGII